MNKPSKCKNCQWYGKPYWSVINPCDNCDREDYYKVTESYYTEDYVKSLLQQIQELTNKEKEMKDKNIIYDLENTLREIIHYCNHLHNDCKYNLNDGHIRKIRNICKRKLEQRGVSDKK